MKNVCISFLALTIIFLSVIGLCLPGAKVETEYLRIHIRADSNDEIAQAVKYKVKDAVIEYLTPYIAECDTKKKAQTLLSDRLDAIEKVADDTLEKYGFSYKSSAKLKREQFPTRYYGQTCLESGVYDALIIELGSGQGDNWWCVVYPPLCFTGDGVKYEYRSKIKDIVDKFFLKKE